MSQRRLRASVRSFGIYQPWTGKRSEVPRLVRFGDHVPAELGIEFGYILRIRDGSGAMIDWRIEHPPFVGPSGKVAPAFTGRFGVKGNDFDFFLGDTVWEPIADKCGPWTMITSYQGQELARQSFLVSMP